MGAVKCNKGEFPDFKQIFHGFAIPDMKLALRNGGAIMDFTVKDGKQKIKGKNSNNSGDKIRLDYKKAIHCIRGSDVTIYDSSNYTNTSDAIRDAIKNISEKQTSRGVTVLCSGWERNDTIKIVKTVTKFSEQPPIYYLDDGAITAGVINATEKEMKMWLNDRGNRNLITNINMAAGVWLCYVKCPVSPTGSQHDSWTTE